MTDHTPYRCGGDNDRCQAAWCSTHHGELFYCSTCRGAEGDLPTHCPGYAMTEDQRQRVMAGWIDYRDGKWRANGRTDRDGNVCLPRDQHGRVVGGNGMK